MTILFLLVPLALFGCLGLVLATRRSGAQGFDADLAAFQNRLGALAPTGSTDNPVDQVPTAGNVWSHPTDSPRSVLDYTRPATATDHRS